MKKPSDAFKNISIVSKIRSLLLLISIGTMLLIGTVSYLTTRQLSIQSQIRATDRTIQNASATLYNSWNDIIRQFVNVCGTKAFANTVLKMVEEPDSFSRHQQSLQNVLRDLQYINYLTPSAMIVAGDRRTMYTLYSSPIQGTAEDFFPAHELEQLHSIRCLPERSSPFFIHTTVLPLVIPIRTVGEYLMVVNDTAVQPELYIVLLIDKERLYRSIDASNVQNDLTSIYLLSSDGSTLMSGMDGSPALSPSFSSMLLEGLHSEDSAAGSERRIQQHHFESSSRYSILQDSHAGDILLLGITQKPDPLSFAVQYLPLMLPFMLLLLLLLVSLSFVTVKYVTRPITKLMSVVEQIRNNSYTEKIIFTGQDEVGKLSRAINRMYETNVRQMQQIRLDEKIRYQSELKLLTEQINPHFLYNTLEEIQAEVHRSDSESASRMIQYLADYLRIGLSGGADTIPIPNEIRHAASYIHIMNQRFGQNILFLHQIEPVLGEVKILKTILQPLLENSIRHGFGIDHKGIPVLSPTLEVSFTTPAPHCIEISVIDNGSGFDPEKVHAIMMHSPEASERRHVGINNTYLRLLSYYEAENISVHLESSPFYRNVISFRIEKAY